MKIPNHSIVFPGFILLLVVSLYGCGHQDSASSGEASSRAGSGSKELQKTSVRYARLFSVEYKNQAKILRIRDPFDPSKTLKTYLLLPTGVEPARELPEGQIVRTPLNQVALAQTTHIGFFNELNLLKTIQGVSQKRYVKNEKIRRQIDSGKIEEFGPSHNINVERLLQINPQVLFVAPFKNNQYKKVRDVGIPIAVNSSYMENTPLARAEWIKFMACFFNKEATANRIFDSIASGYHRLKRRVDQQGARPTIFSGKKIGQVWYVPGGDSYMAHFFEDAGARYLWRDNQQTGSLELDFETVFYKAQSADYWLMKENPQGNYSYARLKAENTHYKEFKAFQQRRILFCNTRTQPYYEEGILEPEVILADLISILHPELLKDHQNKYYQLLDGTQ